jgi:hypothetical protein
MTPELARLALAFLERCDMKPPEIQAYVAVSNALRAIAFPSPRMNGGAVEDAQPAPHIASE